jgi:alcohol dehydrogenase class IV
MKQIIYNGIEHLSEALQGSKKVLLVTDSSFPFLNIKDEVEGMGIPYVKFSDFTPNPLYEDVCKGVDLFNVEECDTILAVGGGSSMDVAKCIKLYCRMSKDSLYLDQEYKDTGVKLIAIPTTAGTGSESTRYAVIYYDGKKQSVTHDSIIPNVAILEPKVLKTLPLYQKKCTMLDALCQGIESWWSVNSTDESKKLSKEAVETIMKWWREYLFENTDESARQIMHAANLAGQAICITQTTAAHAFSYKITSMYKLPHGHAVAICMAEIWEYMLAHPEKCIDRRGQDYLVGVYKEIAASMGSETPYAARDIFACMLKEMDIEKPVTANRDSDISILTSYVNPTRLNNNPVTLGESIIRDLYQEVVK